MSKLPAFLQGHPAFVEFETKLCNYKHQCYGVATDSGYCALHTKMMDGRDYLTSNKSKHVEQEQITIPQNSRRDTLKCETPGCTKASYTMKYCYSCRRK